MVWFIDYLFSFFNSNEGEHKGFSANSDSASAQKQQSEEDEAAAKTEEEDRRCYYAELGIKTLTASDLFNHNLANDDDRRDKFAVVNYDYLEGIIAYAKHIKEYGLSWYQRTPDQRPSNKEIITFRLPNNELLGILYKVAIPPTCIYSEYHVAQVEADVTEEILNLIDYLQNGSITVEEASRTKFTIYKLDVTDSEVLDAFNDYFSEGKVSRLYWSEIQSQLTTWLKDMDAELEASKSNFQKIIEHLKALSRLDLNCLALKKNPGVMNMITDLMYYNAYLYEIDSNEYDAEEVQKYEELIQKEANECYMKFGKLLNSKSKQSISSLYENAMEEFNAFTRFLNENEIRSLQYEPNSRDYFLERYMESAENYFEENYGNEIAE